MTRTDPKVQRISDPVAERVAKAAIDLVIAAAMVMLTLSMWATEAVNARGSAWWIVVLLLAVPARLLMSDYVREKFFSTDRSDLNESVQLDGLDEFIGLAQTTFRERYDDANLITGLVALLIDPSGYFDRIKENVDIKPTWYESRTTMTFVPPSKGQTLVPVLVQRKQVLVDGMRVTVDGKSASSLSYVENQGAILNVVEVLFRQIVPAGGEVLLGRIKKAVADPSRRATSRVVADLNALNLGKPKPPDGTAVHSPQVWRAVLVALVRLLSHSYFILCLVCPEPNSHSTKISVSRRFGPISTISDKTSQLRALVGLNGREHFFGLQRASETTSYHISIDAPQGMYLYRRKYYEVDPSMADHGALPVAPTRRALLPDRIESASPQHLHVYIRDRLAEEGASDGRTPFLGVSLRELPPALLEAGLLLSFYLAMTVWTVGTYHDEIFGHRPLPGTWPTVLFGIPTLLSGWLVARIGSGTLSRMSVVSLVMSIWLAVDSALAVFAAAFKSSDITLTDDDQKIWFLHFEHPIWGTLMLLTALHLALNVVFVLGRAGRYWWTLKKAAKPAAVRKETS